jgi:hypothetical protein
MSLDGSSVSFDYLGCPVCIYNLGIAKYPICGHPEGVKVVISMRCVHCWPGWEAEMRGREDKNHGRR